MTQSFAAITTTLIDDLRTELDNAAAVIVALDALDDPAEPSPRRDALLIELSVHVRRAHNELRRARGTTETLRLAFTPVEA